MSSGTNRERIQQNNTELDTLKITVDDLPEYIDTSDANAVAGDILSTKTAYIKGSKVTGTMPNNGVLDYTPSDNAQTIPIGYTSGGTVKATDITDLQEYKDCLNISTNILPNKYTPVANPLVYYYGTDLQDKSGNNYNGTLTGIYTTTKKGINFNGGYGTTGNISRARGTWEIYCKINSDFTPRSISDWYNCSCIMGCELPEAVQDFGIILNSSGYASIGYGMSSIKATTLKANDGNFHHYVIVTTNTQLLLYIDGEIATSVNYSMSGTVPTQYGIFWNKSSSSTAVKGETQLFRYYTNALTAEQISQNYLSIINDMSELKDNLNAILQEKTTKIIPENIKKDVEILGVTGAYEGSSATSNIYIQITEPQNKQGIWIKSSSFEYTTMTEVSDKANIVASSINFLKKSHTRHKYSTVLINSDMTVGPNYEFDEVYITDSNNDILWNTEIYYGDGINWIECTPIDVHYIGIDVNFSTGTITRVAGNSTGVNDLRCYSERIRCNLQDNGTVTAYYGDSNYDNVGNSNLQVMVEQPAVYYALEDVIVDSNNAITSCKYMVADGPKEGYDLHPAFIKGNTTYSKLYEPAYEATLVNDKLSSIGGGIATPYVNATRATFRTKATNRGTGWQQLTKQIQDLDSLLIVIEYMSFDTQTAIASGITHSSAAQAIGQTYVLDGNGTGIGGSSISDSAPFTWRYRENIWGNVWKWLDGINENGNTWYFTDENYADDTSTNYIQCLQIAANSNGFITRFAYNSNAKWIFMPKTISSNQTGIIKDFYYQQATGWRAFRYGGHWAGGDWAGSSEAGTFFTATDPISSEAASAVGGGLVYYGE